MPETKTTPLLPVKRAPLKLEHFLYGTVSNCCHCVIAKAAQDILDPAYTATMNFDGLRVLDKKFHFMQTKALEPTKAERDLMEDFDSLELYLPSHEEERDSGLDEAIHPKWDLHCAITIFQRVELFMKYWNTRVDVPAEFCR